MPIHKVAKKSGRKVKTSLEMYESVKQGATVGDASGRTLEIDAAKAGIAGTQLNVTLQPSNANTEQKQPQQSQSLQVKNFQMGQKSKQNYNMISQTQQNLPVNLNNDNNNKNWVQGGANDFSLQSYKN